MYSYNDFERLFLRYKLEGIPAGVSIEKFCMSSQVPYNLFSKWYKDIRRKIVRILVDIRMSNGVHISQKNLSYEGLKSLVEKLEVLC